MTTRPRLQVYASPDAVADALFDAIVHRAAARRDVDAGFSIAVPGGSSPRALWTRLASRPEAIDWSRVHVYWTDERFVPSDDPASNAGGTRRDLLDRVPIPVGNVHPIVTSGLTRGESARRYGQELERLREKHPDGTIFDLVILGLGEDGHVASLLPGSPQLESEALAAPADFPTEPRRRITLTPRALRSSKEVFVLALGERKREALRATLAHLEHVPDPEHPATCVTAHHDSVTWWADRAAAGEVG